MQPGDLERATSLDDLVRVLVGLRSEAGSPSFADLTVTVGEVRRERSPSTGASTPGRVTIYDAFRTGRSRIEPALLLDLVRALGRPDLVPAMSAAHRRILGTRPSSPARPRVEVAAPVRPAPDLPDRSTEIERLAALVLDPSHGDGPPRATPDAALRVVVLTGMPGVGKTTFARDLAWRTARAIGPLHPLEVGFRTASGDDDRASLPPRAVAREIVATLDGGARPDPSARRVVVLDDVPSDGDLAGVLALLPSTTIVVATSRRQIRWPDAVAHHRVEPLSPQDTSALLTRLLREHTTPEGEVADAAALLELATHSGGLPLTVTLLAGHAARRPGWFLSDHARRLDSVEVGLAPALEDAYDSLSSRGQEVLRFLARHPGRLDHIEVDAALVTPADTRLVLDSLVLDNLVQRDADGRHDVHDAVRATARHRAVDQVSISDLGRQVGMLSQHLETGVRAARDGSQDASTAWLEQHVEVVVTTAQLAADLGLAAEATALARTMLPYLNHGEKFSDAYLIASAAFADRTRAIPEEDLLTLARAARLNGRFQEARAINARLAAAGCETLELRVELAEAEAMSGDMEMAVTDFEVLLADLAPSDPVWRSVIHKLPQMYVLTGRAEDARRLALSLLERDADRPADQAQAVVESNLSRALRELEDHTGSERAARTCISHAVESGSHRFGLLARTFLADALLSLGDAAQALAVAESAHRDAVAQRDAPVAVITGCALVQHLLETPGELDRAAAALEEVADSLRTFTYPAIEIDHLVARHPHRPPTRHERLRDLRRRRPAAGERRPGGRDRADRR